MALGPSRRFEMDGSSSKHLPYSRVSLVSSFRSQYSYWLTPSFEAIQLAKRPCPAPSNGGSQPSTSYPCLCPWSKRILDILVQSCFFSSVLTHFLFVSLIFIVSFTATGIRQCLPPCPRLLLQFVPSVQYLHWRQRYALYLAFLVQLLSDHSAWTQTSIQSSTVFFLVLGEANQSHVAAGRIKVSVFESSTFSLRHYTSLSRMCALLGDRVEYYVDQMSPSFWPDASWIIQLRHAWAISVDRCFQATDLLDGDVNLSSPARLSFCRIRGQQSDLRPLQMSA